MLWDFPVGGESCVDFVVVLIGLVECDFSDRFLESDAKLRISWTLFVDAIQVHQSR